nr:leucine-rich repeat-containing protein [Tanacetum cinerariifolium]
MMNWNTSTDCCNWNGVSCDYSTGDVIDLDLSHGMLKGTIHPNTSLFNLPRLQRLDLSFNNFSGSQIPREIGRFANSLTHLSLASCSFSGQVPPNITLLHKLVSLNLFPYGYDLKLRPHVFINMLRNFTNLEELPLEFVNISSVLPTSLNISSSLKLLSLMNTGMKGKLPHYIFNLHSFELLSLGGLPKIQWYGLEELYLQSNLIEGPFPPSICNMGSLRYLDRSNNRFGGLIPQCFGQLPAKYFQNFNSMKNVAKNSTEPEYLSMGATYYSFVVAVKGVDRDIPRLFVSLTIIDLSNNH